MPLKGPPDIGLDSDARKLVLDSGVCPKLDLGSDHRSIFVKFRIGGCKKKRRCFSKNRFSVMGRTPKDAAEYHSMLDVKISDLKVSIDLDRSQGVLVDRFSELENMITETADLCLVFNLYPTSFY